MPNLCFIGGGRTGASLTFYFLRQGYPVISLIEKNPYRLDYLKKEFQWNFLAASMDSDKISTAKVIFLTVRDDHLQELAESLSKLKINWNDRLILHCSGTHSSQVLNPLQKIGADIASFHPIYSFSLDPRENHLLNDVWFDIEGESKTLDKIEELFSFKKDKLIRIKPDQKQAVHLACVFYANFYVALAQMSHQLLKNISVPEKKTFQIFRPLLQSSIEQVQEHGPAEALTGPITRADRKILSAHLKYLHDHHPDLLSVYLLFSQRLISLSNLSPKDKSDLTHILQDYQLNL